MPSPDIDYTRSIKKYSKLVARNKWQLKYLPSWWPGVKEKPIIISEGDSWFDYPVKSLTDVLGVVLRRAVGIQGFGMDQKTNVIDWLSRDRKLDGIFLRLERSGDHAQELAAKQPDKKYGVWENKFPSQTLYTALQNKYVRRHLDCIVLSAGGNDMVDAVRHGVIQDYQGSCENSYDKDILKSAAIEIVDYFLQAFLYRDEFTPNAKVLCHSYAYAIQVHRGTQVTINPDDIFWFTKKIRTFMDLKWVKKSLESIGLEISDDGEYVKTSESNLHETFDKKGWPANPVHEHQEGTDPERAKFIKAMLDALYDEMQNLPAIYKAQTGKELTGFEYLDIREEVQEPKYWSDFIHLNGDGYKIVGKKFADKIMHMLR